jgi:phosphopantothenoylcysteine synthetase/decarboxylase
VPIDKVRCITNIFSGRTGAAIAVAACQRGHDVTLLTSHPEAAVDLLNKAGLAQAPTAERWHVHTFLTFDDLRDLMADLIPAPGLDAVIHCAAVSDYQAAGIYAPAPGTSFDAAASVWQASDGQPRLLDRAAGKVKSDENELWLRMIRVPKLVDFIRTAWKFTGVLVKFKLEVGVSDPALLEVAERSRRHSGADLMVANTLEGASSWAYMGPLAQGYERVSRRSLAEKLLQAVESAREQRHG